jgi:hypothetical protein
MFLSCSSFCYWVFGFSLLLAMQSISTRAVCLDLREQISRETQVYRSAHPEFATAPKHDFRRRTALRETVLGMEVPGGVGYGYYFNDPSLRWTNSTILDYYIIAPTTMGGDLDYYLYLTSTCRAQLGTEALVGYFGQSSAAFWIFDWSLSSNKWQAGFELPETHPEYLTRRADEFGNVRQMCHIRNGTFLKGFSEGQYSWENRIWLFNFQRKDWDLLYSHGYDTPSLDSNLFVSAAAHGYWGPIVEVFLNGGTYDNLNPAGFDLARLFQDSSSTNSSSEWLSNANSYSLQCWPFEVLTETPNRGFVVYTGVAPANTFRIASTSGNKSTGQTLINIDTLNGHEYEVFAAATPSGVWAPTGLIISGDGTQAQVQVPMGLPEGFFRIRDSYNTGSLNVIANINSAGFSLEPHKGIMDQDWVAEPDGKHWDKTVVGLRPGTYTISFHTIPGVPPLAPQTISVTSSNISPVTANYMISAP